MVTDGQEKCGLHKCLERRQNKWLALTQPLSDSLDASCWYCERVPVEVRRLLHLLW